MSCGWQLRFAADHRGGKVIHSKAVVVALSAPEKASDWLGKFAEAEPRNQDEGEGE